MFRRTVTFAAVVGFVFVLAPAAQAGTIDASNYLVPADLGVGDTFHLTFLTSTTTSAESDNIADYNAHVSDAANLATSVVADGGWTWKAIVSTPTVDAIENTGTTYTVGSPGFPIYRVPWVGGDDVVHYPLIAEDYADLWDGSIATWLHRTESNPGGDTWSWQATGTAWDGTASANPLGGAGENVTYGENNSTGAAWIASGTYDKTATWFRVYAISEPLEIIPEPATLALLGLGVLWTLKRSGRGR